MPAATILKQMQTGRPALIKKDGGEMLIAIVLDRSLQKPRLWQILPDAFIQALTRQEEPPGHCPDGSTGGGYNEFLQKLQPPSRKSRPATHSHIQFQQGSADNVRFSRLPLTDTEAEAT